MRLDTTASAGAKHPRENRVAFPAGRRGRAVDARRTARPCGVSGILLLVVFATGCSNTTIETEYAKRSGTSSDSVNGTAVFAKMFSDAGFTVRGWKRLSPRLEESKVIVWAPDSYALPSAEERQFLEDWLSHGPGRTLIYVGRDFDASIPYWDWVLKQPDLPGDQVAEVARRLSSAKSDHDADRMAMPQGASCPWFVARRDAPAVNPSKLNGPWSAQIDSTKAELEVRGRLEAPTRQEVEDLYTDAIAEASDSDEAATEDEVEAPDGQESPNIVENVKALLDETEQEVYYWDDVPDSEVLLDVDGAAMIRRLTSYSWGDSQILVVTNGSFLLNLPLVNHEHRKLAGRMIDACGYPGNAYFIESGRGGVPVFQIDPSEQMATGWEMFMFWPTGVVWWHLSILGIIFCFCVLPIFGRPRTWDEAGAADFGKHVRALGALMKQTGQHAYATERLREYQEKVKQEKPT